MLRSMGSDRTEKLNNKKSSCQNVFLLMSFYRVEEEPSHGSSRRTKNPSFKELLNF